MKCLISLNYFNSTLKRKVKNQMTERIQTSTNQFLQPQNKHYFKIPYLEKRLQNFWPVQMDECRKLLQLL